MKCLRQLLFFLFFLNVTRSIGQHQDLCALPEMELSWLGENVRALHPSMFNLKSTMADVRDTSVMVLGRRPFQCVEQISDTSLLAFQLNDERYWPYLKSTFDLYEPLLRKSAAGKCHEDFIYLPAVLTAMNPAYFCEQRSGIFAMTLWVAGRQGLRVDSTIDERRSGDLAVRAAFNQLMVWTQNFVVPDLVLIAWAESPARANELQHRSDWRNGLTADEKKLINLFDYLTIQFKKNNFQNQLHTCFDILGQYAPIRPAKDISIDALCSVMHLEKEDIRGMNPVYIGNKIPHNYLKVPFYVPQQAAYQFNSLEDSIARYAGRKSSDGEIRKIHIVKKGESLGAIAAKYEISTSKLRKTNKLRGNRISAGQRLVITSEKEQAIAIDREIEEEQREQEHASESRRKEREEFTTYIVREGDSIWKISKKFKVKEKQIMQWNHCGENLRIGQKLKIKKK